MNTVSDLDILTYFNVQRPSRSLGIFTNFRNGVTKIRGEWSIDIGLELEWEEEEYIDIGFELEWGGYINVGLELR